MNLGDMKLYQDWEDMQRAKAMREQEMRLARRRVKQKDFEEIYGFAPQNIVSLTTDNLLKMPFDRVKQIFENATKLISKISVDFLDKNGGVDICRCIPFGKHVGRTVWEIINTKPNYALWMHDKTDFKLTDYEVKIAQYVRNNDPLSERLID